MRHVDRLPVLAFLWLFTAAGAGLLAAWLLRSDGGTRMDVECLHRPGADPGEGPTAAASGIASAPAGRVPSSPPAPGGPETGITASPAAAASAAPSAPLPFPSLLVTVFESDGTLAETGTVYAVAAGEEGGGGDRVFHSTNIEEGRARLALPVPGLYDVGFRSLSAGTLQRDVTVGPGERNEATLRVPVGPPVQVRVEGTWPPPGSEEALLIVDFCTEEGPDQVPFPGRGQWGSSRGSARLEGASGSSTPLEPGRVYLVNARVQELRPHYEANTPEDRREWDRLDAPRFQAVPDRPTVRAGETLSVKVEARPTIALLPVLVEPLAKAGPWSSSVLKVHVFQGQVGRMELSAIVLRNPPKDWPEGFSGRIFPLEAGTVRVVWSGSGLLAGSREEIAVRPGETVEVEIPVREDPGWTPATAADATGAAPAKPASVKSPVPEEEPIEAIVEGMPVDGSAVLVACLAGEGKAWTEDCGVTPHEEIRLDPGWRKAKGVIALSPPFLASDFLEVPASGPFWVQLRPAGLLLLAPAEVFPAAFGSLRLRRADGRPIASAREEGTDYAGSDLEVQVRPGLLIGPFTEGTITFEVRLSGLRLPDARATVRAGRIEVLRIAR